MIISVTSNYVQSFSSTNWDKFEDFLYYGRTVDSIKELFRCIVIIFIKIDLLKNYDEANIPEVVEIYGKTFFFTMTYTLLRLKYLLRTHEGKFPNSDINFIQLGPTVEISVFYRFSS